LRKALRQVAPLLRLLLLLPLLLPPLLRLFLPAVEIRTEKGKKEGFSKPT